MLNDRNPGSVTRLLAESFAREFAVLSRQLESVYQAGFLTTADLPHVLPRGPVPAAGPLTRTVLAYTAAMQGLVPTVTTAADWAPLAEFVAVDEFERVGTFLERQDWPQYTEMLTRWAAATDGFETTVRRVTESPGRVHFEIEERHRRNGTVDVVGSMTVFEFDGAGRIRRLDVYLQQPR